MNQPEKNLEENILNSIDCLALLFWNYTDSDVDFLRSSNSNIDYVWGAYIESSNNVHSALWKAWIDKFSDVSKHIIIDYSIKRFSTRE